MEKSRKRPGRRRRGRRQYVGGQQQQEHRAPIVVDVCNKRPEVNWNRRPGPRSVLLRPYKGVFMGGVGWECVSTLPEKV